MARWPRLAALVFTALDSCYTYSVNGWVVIIFGLFLVAIGGFLGFYGDHLNKRTENEGASRELNKKIGEVLDKITEAQRTASSSPTMHPSNTSEGEATRKEQAQQKLESIRQDFTGWATNFLRDRSAKKQQLNDLKTQAKNEELRISSKCRPIFQYTLDVLDGAITAYNKTAGAKFVAQLKTLPQNLYETEGSAFDAGTIQFAPDTIWRISVNIYRPPRDNSPPVLFITIPNPSPGRAADAFRIEVRSTVLSLITGGGGIAGIANVDAEIPIQSYEQPLQQALERLLESQITSLEQNN